MPVLIEKQQPLPTEEAATPVVGAVETPEVIRIKASSYRAERSILGRIVARQ